VISLHSYSSGEEILVPTDTEPLVQEVVPGTVIVFVSGLGVQVQESVAQIRELIAKEKAHGS
jgi:hypothetical protein